METDMSESLQLEYFYGVQAEEYKFYQIPKILITDSRFNTLNNDAKLAYGLLLDRMSLSIKHKWFDEQNRAYIIYTLNEIAGDLNCSPDKITRIYKDLQKIGLIERIRRGLGKPDIIYVKNFASIIAMEEKSEDDNDDLENSSSAEKEPAKSEKTTDSLNCGIKTPQNNESRLSQKRNPNSVKKASNNTNINDTKKSDTKVNDTELKNHSSITLDEGQIEAIKTNIAENINLNGLLEYATTHGEDEIRLVKNLYEIICEMICTPRKYVEIKGTKRPWEYFRKQYLKLKYEHITRILERYSNEGFCIEKSELNFLRAVLYNEPFADGIKSSKKGVKVASANCKNPYHGYEQRVYSDDDYVALEKRKLGIT